MWPSTKPPAAKRVGSARGSSASSQGAARNESPWCRAPAGGRSFMGGGSVRLVLIQATAPLPSGPEKAGLKAGDVIVQLVGDQVPHGEVIVLRRIVNQGICGSAGWRW